MAIRILIAADQTLVRAGLRVILDHQPRIGVVGEAADEIQSVALAHQIEPDVCLFDFRMPEMGGIEATPILTVMCVKDTMTDRATGSISAGTEIP